MKKSKQRAPAAVVQSRYIDFAQSSNAATIKQLVKFRSSNVVKGNSNTNNEAVLSAGMLSVERSNEESRMELGLGGESSFANSTIELNT